MNLSFRKTLNLFLVVLSFLSLMTIFSGKVNAEPAKCFNALGSIGGGDATVTDCSSMSSLAPPGYQFQDDKCYELVVSGGLFSVGEANCSQGVFSRNSGDTSVRCADNQVYTGPGTAEEVCAPAGGVAQTSAEIEDSLNAERRDIIECDNQKECYDKNPIVNLLKVAITFMTGLVGVIVVVVIIWAGIEYSSAGGDPNRTANAKKRIINAIIALVSFVFLWAFLQWLVPGSPF